jgi:hypothetical protein
MHWFSLGGAIFGVLLIVVGISFRRIVKRVAKEGHGGVARIYIQYAEEQTHATIQVVTFGICFVSVTALPVCFLSLPKIGDGFAEMSCHIIMGFCCVRGACMYEKLAWQDLKTNLAAFVNSAV